MISVEEAKSIISKVVKPTQSTLLPLSDARKHVLSEDIYAPISLPPFPQSAMDGYAVRLSDLENSTELKLDGESKAGTTEKHTLNNNTCMRIFTGAPVPDGADAVIIQENTEARNGNIFFKQKKTFTYMNIRPVGEQIAQGTLALKKGTILSPGAIGFISSLGINEVKVYHRPKIGIVITGDELQQPGRALKPGQVYECNSLMLQSVVLETTGIQADVTRIKDDYRRTVDTIHSLQKKYDILIFTGGISVGDYDYVGKALAELKAKTHFYKVNQKPGKPLYFGELGNTLIFGLPGNPAAALTCFYEYVFSAIQKKQDSNLDGLKKFKFALSAPYNKTIPKAQFLKALISYNGEVTVLNAQASSMLSSFSEANGLVYFPDEVKDYKKGEMVQVTLLNN